MIATEVTALRHAGEFDVIHAHLEWAGLLLARASSVPVVNTFHGRLDQPFAADAFADPPAGLVAISHSQASSQPDLPWTIVYNGLDLAGAPFEARPGDALCFVGRVAPEKGIVEAIEVARRAGRRLRIAAKVGVTASERAYHEEVFLPATRTAEVELLGELSSTDRDRLFAESYAAQRVTLRIEDIEGRTVRELRGATDVGLNRVAWDLVQTPRLSESKAQRKHWP